MEPKGFVGGRKSLSGPKQLQKRSDYTKHHGFLEGFITTCTLLRMALWEDWDGGGGCLGSLTEAAHGTHKAQSRGLVSYHCYN